MDVRSRLSVYICATAAALKRVTAGCSQAPEPTTVSKFCCTTFTLRGHELASQWTKNVQWIVNQALLEMNLDSTVFMNETVNPPTFLDHLCLCSHIIHLRLLLCLHIVLEMLTLNH